MKNLEFFGVKLKIRLSEAEGCVAKEIVAVRLKWGFMKGHNVALLRFCTFQCSSLRSRTKTG